MTKIFLAREGVAVILDTDSPLPKSSTDVPTPVAVKLEGNIVKASIGDICIDLDLGVLNHLIHTESVLYLYKDIGGALCPYEGAVWLNRDELVMMFGAIAHTITPAGQE